MVWAGISAAIFYLFLKWEKGERELIICVFSAIFSMSVVLGYHIQMDGEMYTGLMYENYMTSLSLNDLLAWIALTATIAAFLKGLASYLKTKANTVNLSAVYGIGNVKTWILTALLIFAAWLPYLLVYYPGFIFGDSLGSIGQAVGGLPWNNHHPIFYTFFLKICLEIGMLVKDITFGCAVYTVIQMIYVALCLGYQICWLKQKGISFEICAMLAVYFGCVPFFAQNSIAMWKDPIFSATLTVWTLLLADFTLSDGMILLKDRSFMWKNALLLTILCFSRNNGIYIGLFCALVMFSVIFIMKKGRVVPGIKNLLTNTIFVLLAVGIVIGPVYKGRGLSGEPVESRGIFLNQMARVAAYDGNMSDADREYMDKLLPLEKYKDTYRPCVVDRLKWDENFSQEYLNANLDGFMKTYFSLLVKNPYCYLESWVLNTYGYWAVNRWELNLDEYNIYKGNLNHVEYGENYGINPHGLLENENVDMKSVIRAADSPISLAVLTWLVFFIVLLILKNRKWVWGIVMAPSLGLVATLFIATPYAYWQRYGLAQYYLVPVYLLLAVYVSKA